jgi:3-hydroxyisobutyrate dehydrogenase-like beta-hydroxyacid dehydrogenase
VIAIHSTVHPDTCHELADAATKRGVVVVDAPVSGGRQVALSGKLVVAVGADEDTFDRCRPVFESFGDPVIHLGPVGTGQFAKLVNNALLAANLALANDALNLAPSLGLQPDALVRVLQHGSGRSFALDVAVGSRTSAVTRERTVTPLGKDVRCLTAVLGKSAEAAVLTFTAGVGVRRLADAARWTW